MKKVGLIRRVRRVGKIIPLRLLEGGELGRKGESETLARG